MDFHKTQELSEFIARQLRYASADGQIALVSIGTVNDGKAIICENTPNQHVSNEWREIFLAVRRDGAICGLQISFNMDSANPNARVQMIRDVLTGLARDPNCILTDQARPIVGGAEYRLFAWVSPFAKFTQDNDPHNGIIKDFYVIFSGIPPAEKLVWIAQIFDGACDPFKPPAQKIQPTVDEPIAPETAPATTTIQLNAKSKMPWLQKIITGSVLASVALMGAFAALVSAQSMAAVWKSAVHVIGLTATAIPTVAAGIIGMMAVDRIDKAILNSTDNKFGLFPTLRKEQAQYAWSQRRNCFWSFTKYGCITIVGAAGMVGFMRWDHGNIYQRTQNMLLPDKMRQSQPPENKKYPVKYPPVPLDEFSRLRIARERQNTI